MTEGRTDGQKDGQTDGDHYHIPLRLRRGMIKCSDMLLHTTVKTGMKGQVDFQYLRLFINQFSMFL